MRDADIKFYNLGLWIYYNLRIKRFKIIYKFILVFWSDLQRHCTL